jgi:phospholipid/cholesterol/gamma-HCH transport system ATP-binding protein
MIQNSPSLLTSERVPCSACQLTYSVQGARSQVIFSDLSFSLLPRTLYGLIGPSGGGKTTLLKVIAGILSPQSGTIEGIPKRTSLLFQEGALFDSMTVEQNVAFPFLQGKDTLSKEIEVRRKVVDILRAVGLGEALYKVPAQLSGGMRKRAALARALVTQPHMALLDDPTSGLDPVASNVIMTLIKEFHTRLAATTVVVSHDLRRLLPHVDRVICLFHGRICFEGSVHELLSSAPEEVRYFVRCRFSGGEESLDVKL